VVAVTAAMRFGRLSHAVRMNGRRRFVFVGKGDFLVGYCVILIKFKYLLWCYNL
jgi:hypothetical protein